MRPRAGPLPRVPTGSGAATPGTRAVQAALADLRQLAGRLQQAQAAVRAQATLARAAHAPPPAAPVPATEPLARLEHGLELAMALRQHCDAERTRLQADLARLERKQAKKQDQLDLALALREADTTAAPSRRTTPPRAMAPPGPVEPRAPTSARTKEAKARLATLERQLGALDSQFRNVLQPRAEAAKQALQKQQQAVEALLLSQGVRPILHREMDADRQALCQRVGLPDVFAEVHAGTSPPFEQYLARFTETDHHGARQLHPDFLHGEPCGTALSTLCEAATCSVGTISPLSVALVPQHPQAGMLRRLVTGSPDEVARLLQGAIANGLDRVMAIELPALIRDGANQPSGPATRPEKARRRTMQEAAQRAGQVLALFQRHRGEAASSLMQRTTRILAVVADEHRGQSEAVATLEQQWEARREHMRANLAEAQDVRARCTAARTALQDAQEADRSAGSATRSTGPARAAPPSSATVTATTLTTAGPDLDARIARLRGELDGLAGQCTQAQGLLEAAAEADKSAARAERKAQAAYDTAVAAHGRAQDTARRERQEAQKTQAQQREQQAQLAQQVAQAQDALMNHPALTGLLLPADALARAIGRHVEPEDDEQHRRARHDTGYAATYHSPGHLVEAACDVYQDAMAHCPGLFAARSRAEFSAAATLLEAAGVSLADRVHPHRRPDPIARGYSNAPDQTARPVPVNESCYSLRWQDGSGPGPGRVIISHLYPFVPHRQLRTLEP